MGQEVGCSDAGVPDLVLFPGFGGLPMDSCCLQIILLKFPFECGGVSQGAVVAEDHRK
jgi:hypothetical protein